MKKALLLLFLCLNSTALLRAQDTFSIVALDTITGEVGSAGASCVNLFSFGLQAGFLGELLPGVGAINTQAAYLAANQNNARARMQAGDSPAQIISWLVANDAQGNPGVRQYGIVSFTSGSPQSAAHTGASTITHAGHRTGSTYSIQGNILLGPQILDSMEYRFLNTPGTLATRLMSAMQGANVVGADTRCASNGTSSLFAFLKVSGPTDPFGSPYLNLGVITATNAQIEPIDSLQLMYNSWLPVNASAPLHSPTSVKVWPNPASSELFILASEADIVSAEIYSCMGKISQGKLFDSRTGKIDVSGLAAGMYVVMLYDTQEKKTTVKFVKE